MNLKNKHIDHNDAFEKNTKQFFSGLEVGYNKSKEDIWNDMFKDMVNQPVPLKPKNNTRILLYAVAAAITLLLSTGLAMKFYTRTIYCAPGKQLTAQLPDGSKVKLNAESSIAFQPFWWHFSRQVQFYGEGFFKVKPGEKFAVESSNGTTTVLGTSFTVYNRDTTLKVTCLTGSVKVQSLVTQSQVVLKPKQKAVLTQNGSLQVKEQDKTYESTAWMNKEFFFTSAPLNVVIEEIARRYGIQISVQEQLYLSDYNYTGNFTMHKSVENVIQLVCKTFDLNYLKISNNKYRIVKNSSG